MTHQSRSIGYGSALLLLSAFGARAQTAARIDACDLRLSVTQLRTVDSVRVRGPGSSAALRAPTGSKLVLASLRGNAAQDTVLSLSSDAFAARHNRGVSNARVVAFADIATPLESTVLQGEGSEVSRAVRRGPFTLYVGFFVPSAADEVMVSYLCQLPGSRKIG